MRRARTASTGDSPAGGNRKGAKPLGPRPRESQFANANWTGRLVTVATATEAAAVTAATTAAAATAAEAAATLAAAEAAATTATTEGTLFLRTGFVDLEGATAELDPVGLLDGDLGLIGRAHGDEREAARAARELVHGDVEIGHGAELLEMGAEFVFGGLERQVTDV